MQIIRLTVLIAVLACFTNVPLFAQSPPSADAAQISEDVLTVGIVVSPPYAIKDSEGNWSGISVELWRNLAEQEKLRYEFREFDKVEAMEDALAAGALRVALAADLTAERTDSARFLQHHYLTTLGMARPQRNQLWNTVRSFFSMQLLWIILSLSALLLVVGTIIYFVERKPNEDQFGGDRSTLQGIGSGFWWAGVTMTTIGYGDKAPVSLGGRIVAMLWMLIAMAVSASLTAALVSATSAKDVIDFPNDLTNYKVAAMEASAATTFLDNRGYEYTTFESLEKAMESIKDQDFDLVVGDVTALRYLKKNNTNISASVTATGDAPVAYAIMVREDGELADRLDGTLTKFILSPAYQEILANYGGER